MICINDLPEVIMEYIMLSLSPYGELQSCRLVCHKWNRLSSGAALRLWKLLLRADSFDWLLLVQPEGSKFSATVAERCSHAACYHSDLGEMFLFGGCTAAYTTFNDLWKFDLNTRRWLRPVPAGNYPSPKACATMVQYGNGLFLFGGWSKSSPNPIHQTAMFFNELHMYDPNSNDWRSVDEGGRAPHLAGHSVSVIEDQMIIFGGSNGRGSSNSVWVFNFTTHEWFSPSTSNPKPSPRYGQTQVNLDNTHILIVGGCGGPNLIYNNDTWLLTIRPNEPWLWEEINVSNKNMGAPQQWSHPGCKIANKLVYLSKPLRSYSAAGWASSKTKPQPLVAAQSKTANNTEKNLVPPRRKLITSRSLDEQDPQPRPKCEEKKITELQRARSIPAIIVGEIPKLVVTKDDNSGDSSGSDSSTGSAPSFAAEALNLEKGLPPRQAPCIAMVGSSLLPNQATRINLPHGLDQSPSPEERPLGPAPAPYEVRSEMERRNEKRRLSAAKPATVKNREKQLQALKRMEEYIRSKSQAQEPCASSVDSAGASSSSPGSSHMGFRPSSPPPKSKHRRPENFLLAKNPMSIYILDLSEILEHRRAKWSILDRCEDAPEDTILYSLIKARGELIMFGGLRSSNDHEQQGLNVTPFTHTISNETYILKPPVKI